MNNQSRKRDLPDSEEMSKAEKKDPASSDPKDGERNREKPDSTSNPPKSQTGDPSRNDEPAWFTELPEETRNAILSRRTEDVPAKLRPLLERYRQWLLTKPRKRQ